MNAPDVVVIGGGPTAAMAAQELVRAGADVTMLDSGLRAPRGLLVRASGHTVFRWTSETMSLNRHVSSTDPSTTWYSSLSLGGLSNFWTGAVPRFAPEDFDEGARIDDRYRWPITYDDLAPYYAMAEEVLSVTAGEPFARVPAGHRAITCHLPDDWAEIESVARSRGDGLGVMPLAKGSKWMVALRPTEFSSYHRIVRRLTRFANFRLVPGAHAVRIEHSRDATAATSVTYVDRVNGEVRTMAANAFVVAAGALDSTELLMRSSSNAFPTGLGDVSGVLGAYLHDHPREWWPVELSTSLTAPAHPLYLARQAYEQSDPLLATGLTIGLASNRDRGHSILGRRVERIGVQVFGTMIPQPSASLRLADRSDLLSVRSRLMLDLQYDATTVRNLVRARDRLEALLADSGISARLGPFHKLSPGSSVHLGGTARMHDQPEVGFVDGWNRCHHVPNLIVCDASTFTTGPEKNPTLTAMAIAARAGQALARRLAGARSEVRLPR